MELARLLSSFAPQFDMGRHPQPHILPTAGRHVILYPINHFMTHRCSTTIDMAGNCTSHQERAHPVAFTFADQKRRKRLSRLHVKHTGSLLAGSY